MIQSLTKPYFEFHAQEESSSSSLVHQQEKLATLGKLTAGIAHELNNPTLAIRRSTQRLGILSPLLQTQLVDLVNQGVDGQLLTRILVWRQTVVEQINGFAPLPAVELEERAAQLGNWLFTLGFDDAWDAAESFVSMRIFLEICKN